MSKDPKSVDPEAFRQFGLQVTKDMMHQGLEIAALEQCLIDAGILTAQQLTDAREKIKSEGKVAIAALQKPTTLQ